MTFFFFGSAERQLFGVYHAAQTAAAERGAALLCPPWGPEYIASHRILRRLALMLAESGYHVLRFDYFGTGDSAGSREEGDLDSWYEDASAAIDELRDMSGVSSVTVFGLRLGAHTAWRLALGRDDVDAVVMWDPIVDGERYVRDLVGAQIEIDRWWLSGSGPRRPIELARYETIDLLGFPLTTEMRRTIEAIKPDDYARPTSVRVSVFFSSADEAERQLRDAFQASGTSAVIETMVGQTPWREDDGSVASQLPFPILERMVQVAE